MLKRGTYKMAKEVRVRCGSSVATVPAGHYVVVKQTDKSTHKQLLDFGDRMIDWFHESDVESWLEHSPEPAEQAHQCNSECVFDGYEHRGLVRRVRAVIGGITVEEWWCENAINDNRMLGFQVDILDESEEPNG